MNKTVNLASIRTVEDINAIDWESYKSAKDCDPAWVNNIKYPVYQKDLLRVALLSCHKNSKWQMWDSMGDFYARIR